MDKTQTLPQKLQDWKGADAARIEQYSELGARCQIVP